MAASGAETSDRHCGAAVPAALRQFGRTSAGETPAPQFRTAVPDSCNQRPPLLCVDWQSRVAVSGSVIGRRDLWGRGLGSDAARVRNRYAFEVLGLRLLIASVIADNEASLAMLSRVGYTEAGRVPERYWKRGAFRDQVLLVLRKDG
jgi:hypothetical protein